LSGAASAALIALVNHTLARGQTNSGLLAAGFAGLLIAKVGSNMLAQLLLNHFAQRTLTRLSANLSRQVLATPLRRLEQVGIPRILTTLTDDVAMIGWATINIPSLGMNAAILIGCAVYLAWLSWPVLLAVVMLVAIGAAIHRLLESRAFRHMQRARDTREILFQHFRTLTEGIKELKIHAGRRREFMIGRVDPTLETLQHAWLGGVRHHVVAMSWNQLLSYALLGVLLFTIPSLHAVSWETLTGYVLVTLYMMTPVWSLMDAWPVLARGRIALEKVRDLGLSLSRAATAEEEKVLAAPASVAQLEVDGVVFEYGADAGDSFVLGPLDLTLRPNEVVFLVGGNGSGKSTLVKVLTGLYPPTQGAIRLNGLLIDDKNREWFSQHFSAVFSDFYLFDSLLGLHEAGLDERAQRSLVRLELDAKVRVEGGRFSTTALSQGQRKRLALLTAFLEDRPIYVFDEWAADQDAHYREIFYRQILPELRSQGKTVLVISHDDRYYHLGDRVLKLEYGKLVD
jgi:putative pyoverdin transport system ATP-binding/permease protein